MSQPDLVVGIWCVDGVTRKYRHVHLHLVADARLNIGQMTIACFIQPWLAATA